MGFKEYKGLDLPGINQDVLAYWKQHRTFEKSLSEREGAPSFVFYEGPPSANGMPGIHHVMARTIKDIFCRYKTLRGYRVNRKAGWDTHGLPVELGVEKSLGITKEDIGKKISVDEYNLTCRREVMKFTREWENLTQQMGYWIDMASPYITYDNRYIETLWWLLRQLYDKGLLYKGYTIQPYSPAAGTGLSTHELNQPGCYRDVKDTTVTGLFRMTDPRPEMAQWGTPCFVAWTTTPWTLPSNTALCVGPAIDYVAVQTYNPYTADRITVVMAEARLGAYLKPEGANLDMDGFKPGAKVVPYRIVGRYKGSDLEGMHYAQLMPWVKPVEKISDTAAPYVLEAAGTHPEKVFQVGQDAYVELSDKAFRVIIGDYVTTEDGTGIVHIAPTFGADDARVARNAGIPSLFMVNKLGETRPMVDMTGKYYLLEECAGPFVACCVNQEAYSGHAGDYVKNAYAPQYNVNGRYDEAAAQKDEDLNIRICMEMKQQGTAFKIEKHVHNYPHCWRTDKPVLYYPLDSWFIRSTAVRDRMVELNGTICWKPQSTGTGRFGKWLENLNDWNLSRSRYWGTPLPIWRNRDTREECCIGSVEELYHAIDKSVEAGFMTSNPYRDKGFVPGLMTAENYGRIDLHRPYVDDIVLVSPSGRPMHRETDLIDVWFDSGSMPFAQLHYPFENKDLIDSGSFYPADFISEGVDQTRGWFFTLHAISTMVKDSVAFRHVISNGLVLDKNGNKMSKRLGNAVDPFSTIAKYGSDPLRWYMITNASPWDNLKFDTAGVEEVMRKFFGTLYNTYSFFALYANVDGFDAKAPEIPVASRPEIDRWIMSLLNTLISEVEAAYEDYEPTRAGRLVQQFVTEDLSNWYVRLNRKRFWGGSMTPDKLAAYQTLYSCLLTVAKLASPIAPFFMERLYLDLTAVSGSEPFESVHLSNFPQADTTLVDKDLEEKMELAQQISSMVLALRRKADLKVRQPLSRIMVPILDNHVKQQLEAVSHLIKNEVNIKQIEYIEDTIGILEKSIKANFKVLGPKYSKLMKGISAAIQAFSQTDIATLERTGSFRIEVEGQPIDLTREDVIVSSQDIPGWEVLTEDRLTVALDTVVTDELRCEGAARELVNRIQNLRKETGLEVTDKIRVTLSSSPETDAAVAVWGRFISSQVLASELSVSNEDIPGGTWVDMDGVQVRIAVEKFGAAEKKH